jgi:ornithine cyclodeaminase/alanine dehydrogenase-like protein (mu-crystallin family)
MLILTDDNIRSLLKPLQVLEAVEAAILSYEAQTSLVPKRMHMDHGADTLLCMPSFSNDFFGVKLVSVVPGNASKQLPVTNGVMILNDKTTGLPLALMNASSLTALRTGAVGATGLKYMTPPETNSIGLIGYGVQGMYQALFACHVRPVQTIYCQKRNDESFKRLQQFITLHHPTVKIVSCSTVEELLSKTEVIITATTSPTPVLPDNAALLKGKHFISVGSYKSFMQELPDAVYQLVGELVLDSEFGRQETGDSIHCVEKGYIKPEDIFSIGKLINGERKLNSSAGTVYKTSGMALFDLFVAQYMYEVAKQKKAGISIHL